ncbi:MAG: DNA translocase FtsK 4TM domain-containing protein, partial [Mariprofundaceae bacterium]|nr:DNA translocase FtsK 4TM domain-containing protein [Mariprofundaceae bacterium]
MSDSDKAGSTPLVMREALAFLVFAGVAMLAVSLYSFHVEDPSLNQATTVAAENMLGTVGAWIADMMYQLFGLVSWLLVLLGLVLVIRIVGASQAYFAGWTSIFWLPCLMAISGLLQSHITVASMQELPWGMLPAGAGGALGILLVGALSERLYTLGSDLVLIALMLSSFVIASHISLLAAIQRIILAFFWFFRHLNPCFSKARSALQGQWNKLCAFFKARTKRKPVSNKNNNKNKTTEA